MLEDVTADFVYVRLHGDEELYAERLQRRRRSTAGPRASAPGAAAARSPTRACVVAGEPRRARKPRDVYCYFDNDVKVHAPFDAAHLAARLGVATGLAPDERFVPPPGLAPPRARSPAFS